MEQKMSGQYVTYETWSPDMKNRSICPYKLDHAHQTAGHYQQCLKTLAKHRNLIEPVHMNDEDVYGKCFGDHWPTCDLDPQPIRKPRREPHVIDDLVYQLKNSRFHLSEARKAMNLLRNQIVLLRELISRETGDDVMDANLPYLLKTSRYPTWKERSQRIQNLRARVVNLEYQLQQARYSKHNERETKPKPQRPPGQPLPPASERVEENDDSGGENVIHRQKRVLRIQYGTKKASFDSEQSMDEIMKQFKDTCLMYKASMARNKMLTDELTAMNDEMDRLKNKEREDNELIEALMQHQRHLKDILDQERHLCDSTYEHQYGKLQEMHHGEVEDVAVLHDVREALETKKDTEESETSESSASQAHMNLEREKYKTLFESTRDEKQTLDQMVGVLRKRIEDVTRQVVEAQRHCEEQRAEIKKLNDELEALKRSGKAIPKTRETEDKSARGVLLQEQLQLVQDENQYLRSFLQKAIMTKEDDFRVYQSTMENAKQHYLRNLEEIKSRVTAGN